jgi:ABC-type nitrate/sulfonate/bicarbonate transport system substrate-binding protein
MGTTDQGRNRRHRLTHHRRALQLGAVCSAAALALAACSSSSKPAATAPAASTSATTSVIVALDYIANNAGFDGFYVAQKMGYFQQAGLKVTILPYANTTADILVNAGKADFGTIDEPSLIIDDASGETLQSVMDIMQHEASRLAVRSSLGLTSPKQLTGKTFGGFGVPMEQVFNDATISAAGGLPHYKTVTLGTDVYDALRGGQVDWAIPYATDDILWAQMLGHPFTVFNPQDFGVSDDYGKLVFSSQKYLSTHAATARAFVAALQKGYTWAAHNPGPATQILNEFGVGTMNMPDQEGTAQDLAKNYWLDSSGVVGPEVGSMWQTFANLLTKYKVLKSGSGAVLTTAPDTSTYWTNQYLP